MKPMAVFFVGVCCIASPVRAQDAIASPDTDLVETTPLGAAEPSPRASYYQMRREELQRGIKRTRTALIITSASFAVGLALVVPAFTSDNCAEIDDDYSCTRAGKALLGVGIPFLSVGFYGAIVSGIMLGVRKGKVRRLDEKAAYESKAKLRWDPYRSTFVF